MDNVEWWCYLDVSRFMSNEDLQVDQDRHQEMKIAGM